MSNCTLVTTYVRCLYSSGMMLSMQLIEFILDNTDSGTTSTHEHIYSKHPRTEIVESFPDQEEIHSDSSFAGPDNSCTRCHQLELESRQFKRKVSHSDVNFLLMCVNLVDYFQHITSIFSTF